MASVFTGALATPQVQATKKRDDDKPKEEKMQKLINVLAVLSFVGTAGIVGGGAYVYLNEKHL